MNNKELSITKWQSVLNDLQAKLTEGEFSVGAPFFSIDEICEKYSVSNTTTKKVFAELKKEGWINPVRRKGTTVGRNSTCCEIIYVTHSDILLGDVLDPFTWWSSYNLPLEGLKKKEDFYNVRTTAIGHKFFFTHMNEFKDKDVIMSEAFLRYLDNGDENQRKIIGLLKTTIRPIIINTAEDISEGFTRIGTDYGKAMTRTVNHLINKGHRRIAFLNGDIINFAFFHLQFHGYLDTLKFASIPRDLNLIKTTDGNNQDQDWNALEELLALPDPPTAVACANDTRALHLLEYCRYKGIRVPEDLAVTGFDNREETRFSRPPLTTVDSQLRKHGEKAAELLMKRAVGKLKEPVTIKMEPELVIRQST